MPLAALSVQGEHCEMLLLLLQYSKVKVMVLMTMNTQLCLSCSLEYLVLRMKTMR
jgi:hypothetical protein